MLNLRMNSSIQKPNSLILTQTQFVLPNIVTCSPGNKTTLIDNLSINSLEYYALDPFPTNRTLVGAVYLWSQSSWMVPVDVMVNVSEQKISIAVYNPTSSSFAIEIVRCLFFWQ